MKVLIWFVTFLVGTVLNTLLGYVIGIKAGAAILYVAEYYFAKKLCEKWDQHKVEKQLLNKNVQKGEVEIEAIVATEDALEVNLKTPERKIQYCRRCCAKLVEGSEFCSNCGTPIKKGRGILICPNCRVEQSDDSEFCQYCGSKILASVGAAPFTVEKVSAEQSNELKSLPTVVASEYLNEYENKNHKTKNAVLTEKRPLKKWIAAVVFLSVCLLALTGLNIYQYMSVQDKTVKMSELSERIDELNSTLSQKETSIKTKNSEITTLKNQVDSLKDSADKYETIINAVKHGNLGYAASNFQSSEDIIVVGQNETNRKFTLVANWPNGGSVSVGYDTYYPAASIDFDQDNWTTSTKITVNPNYSGVTVVTFSNDVDWQAFDIIIIVD